MISRTLNFYHIFCLRIFCYFCCCCSVHHAKETAQATRNRKGDGGGGSVDKDSTSKDYEYDRVRTRRRVGWQGCRLKSRGGKRFCGCSDGRNGGPLAPFSMTFLFFVFFRTNQYLSLPCLFFSSLCVSSSLLSHFFLGYKNLEPSSFRCFVVQFFVVVAFFRCCTCEFYSRVVVSVVVWDHLACLSLGENDETEFECTCWLL